MMMPNSSPPRRATAFGEAREPFRDDAQHLIAEPVAIDVVDRLEIVEVDDEQRADLGPIMLGTPFVEFLG